MKRLIALLLSSPLAFNGIRKFIAGDQRETKRFVSESLKRARVHSVLDVGCGTGDFATCTPTSATYTGIDLNEHYIKYASAHFGGKKKKFAVQDVTEKSFYSKKKFDAVLFVSMLHHLSDDELAAIMPAIKKITGGVIIIADIIPDPPGFLQKLMVRLDQGRYIRTRQEKLKLLKKYFKVTETKLVHSRLAIQFCIICRP